MARSFSNVVGFDDSPFDLEHRGDVRVVGAVCARTRLDGVLSTTVRRDGNNATDRLIELVQTSRFQAHIRAVLLQGIALAGFNVVDLERLGEALAIPVLVVVRKQPRLQMVKDALLQRTAGGAEKWRLIEKHQLNRPPGRRFEIGDECADFFDRQGASGHESDGDVEDNR